MWCLHKLGTFKEFTALVCGETSQNFAYLVSVTVFCKYDWLWTFYISGLLSHNQHTVCHPVIKPVVCPLIKQKFNIYQSCELETPWKYLKQFIFKDVYTVWQNTPDSFNHPIPPPHWHPPYYCLPFVHNESAMPLHSKRVCWWWRIIYQYYIFNETAKADLCQALLLFLDWWFNNCQQLLA